MFAVFHLNIRSLNCNYASLLMLLNDLHFKFDVIVLSEIWTVNLPFLANILNGFNFHYNLPKESTVGGIGIFIRDSINYNISHDLNIESTHTNLVENLWLEININEKPYILGAIYRHPNHSVSEFTNALEIVMDKIATDKKSCIIVGDINIDLIKFNHDSSTSNFLNTMITNNYLPVITMPTRITPKSATLVDHIYFFNNNLKQNLEIHSGNIFSDITDHLPIFFIIKYSAGQR